MKYAISQLYSFINTCLSSRRIANVNENSFLFFSFAFELSKNSRMHGNFKEERKIAKSEDSDYNVGELKKKKWNEMMGSQ